MSESSRSKKQEPVLEVPFHENTELTLEVGPATSPVKFRLGAAHRDFDSQLTRIMLELPQLLEILQPAEAGGGEFAFNVVRVSGDYVVTTLDGLILVDASAGAVNVSLPSAKHTGKMLVVVKTDASANVVVIAAFGNDLIEGQGSATLSSQWSKVSLIADGISGWVEEAS